MTTRKGHEVEILNSEACRGNKLKGGEICPTRKALDVVLTVGFQYGILEMTGKIEEQYFRNVHGDIGRWT
jgi:hypothetical protein